MSDAYATAYAGGVRDAVAMLELMKADRVLITAVRTLAPCTCCRATGMAGRADDPQGCDQCQGTGVGA